MNETFLKNMWLIAGIHLVVVVGILISPWFRRFWESDLLEDVVYVDLVDSLPSQAAAVVAEPDPVPARDPEPPPPIPVPIPDTIPEPPTETPREEPPPRRREPIPISQERVFRPGDEPPPPRLSEAEVRRQMEQAANRVRSDTTTTSTIPRSYHDHVGQVMYSAWREPGGLSLPPGAKTTVTIRINRDGTIASRRQTGSSGNAVMDSSVMAAVQSVTKLQPLPANMRGNHADISIDFVLTAGGR